MNNILSIENLCFSYGTKEILKNISLDFPRGNFISIIGPNGSGKTTLLKILSGLINPNTGNIFYENTNLKQIPIKERAKQISVIHQNEFIQMPYTCIDTVIMGLHPHLSRFQSIKESDYNFVKNIMEITSTYEYANKLTSEISGGELQRVNLARAFVTNPKLLLMDEAMSDMDVHAKLKLTKLVKNKVIKDNLTCIAINHDINMAYRFSDYILVLNEGKIVGFDTPTKLISNSLMKEVFRVNSEIIPNKGIFILESID